MCQLWQFLLNLENPMTLRRRRATDCKFQVPDHQGQSSRKVRRSDVPSQENPGEAWSDRLHVTGVRHLETGHTKFQNAFNLSKKVSLANSSTHTNVVVEQLVVEPKGENHLMT